MKYAGEKNAGMDNNAAVARMTEVNRRKVWHIVIGVGILALIMAIAGCLFMMRTQGIQSEVASMRNEIGETLTMMTLGDSGEAVARYIPKLIDGVTRWNRKFVAKSESFRGLDDEIDKVQTMLRLGESAKRWHRDMENTAPSRRNDFWIKTIKPQVESEQKKWPNRTHKKSSLEWVTDSGKEIWYGVKYGATWPKGVYRRTVEIAKGGPVIGSLGVGDRFRYILFPYRLSAFTMLRFFGIVLTMSIIGYLLCWIGLKSRFGWMSYVGLLYFVYLLVIAIFIVWLEVTS